MSDQPNTPDDEPDEGTESLIAEPMETPDAPAADVPKPEASREEVLDATDAIDDVPDEPVAEPADEPVAAAPAKPKKDKAPPPTRDKPAARKPTPDSPQAAKGTRGKVARDKHGRPIVDGPVVQAHAKYVRTSARKARLVCDHIRGKDVEQARAILAFTPRGAAEAWTKLLESAVANAEHNHELVGDDLRIHAVHADEGPTLKRFRPRAMGRATKIRKRTSHLSITLTPKA